MPANIPLMLVVSATLATVTLSPHTAFAQFPPPPPMAGPPPIAAGGPPPLATGGPPAFAARPPMGPGGVPRAGPAPRLGEASAPRGALAAAERAGAGGGHAGRAVASAARGTSVTYNRFEGYGRYGGSRQGYRAAVAAGAMPPEPRLPTPIVAQAMAIPRRLAATTSTGATGAFSSAISTLHRGRFISPAGACPRRQ